MAMANARERQETGPVARYVRDLAKDLPKHAVNCIESFGGDMIEAYRIAEGTLQELTGVAEDDEKGKRLLHLIRCGFIDFVECLRVRREGPKEAYRQWLSDELVRAESGAKDYRPNHFAPRQCTDGSAKNPRGGPGSHSCIRNRHRPQSDHAEETGFCRGHSDVEDANRQYRTIDRQGAHGRR